VTIAKDNEIELSLQDINFLKNKLSVNGKLNYENVIKDLTLVAVPVGFDLSKDQTLPLASTQSDEV
jgi:hypothetical protein